MEPRQFELHRKGNLIHRGKSVELYKFTPALHITILDQPKNPLGPDPVGGALQLGCESVREMQEWIDAFRKAA